jgi:hypothetical protein
MLSAPYAERARAWARQAPPLGPTVLATIALLGAVAYAFAIVHVQDPIVLLPLAAAIVVLGIWAQPVIGLYVVFAGAILLEQFVLVGVDPITQTKFFVNISAYSPLPIRLSLADLIMLLAGAAFLVRRHDRERLRIGALGLAVLGYVGAFMLGTVIGAARGGVWNTEVALAELKAPMQLAMAYFLTANLVRDRGQLTVFVWLFVLGSAVKAFQTILNHQAASDLPYDLRTIIAHEDVVFMGAAVMLALVALLLGHRSRLVFTLLALQPLFLIAELLAYRRVAFIALGVMFLAVVLMAAIARPRRTAVLVGIVTVGLGLYLVSFWDATGPAAEPLRALRSVVDASSTDLEDQASSAWRDVEHQNIAYTIRQLPITGVGVGQRYLFEREPAENSFIYWRFITHDALLWLWLKAGALGAFALWFLVARAVLLGTSLFRRVQEPSLRWYVTLPVLLVLAQVVFSSVDLGLTYSRTMIVLGASLGLAAFVAGEHARSSASGASQLRDGCALNTP